MFLVRNILPNVAFIICIVSYLIWKCPKVKSLSCPTLCDPMDCSLPGSSVHGIFQAIILEWVAISFSRASSQPRDQTHVSCSVGRRFYYLSHQGGLVLPHKYSQFYLTSTSFSCIYLIVLLITHLMINSVF